jgi:light-regulated signal transduction histidine kinase (bacteriophytochrome)
VNFEGQSSATAFDIGALPVVPVAEVHLMQIFQNLIGNALKYRSEATPQISIGAELKDRMWRFYVGDNGIGIEPQYRQQVFGLFKRLHNSSAAYAGSGVGLSICQKIVERYGGCIWVESEGLGRGSTFYFTLPQANATG